jgi:membrane-bound lytic murein transglycosylase D
MTLTFRCLPGHLPRCLPLLLPVLLSACSMAPTQPSRSLAIAPPVTTAPNVDLQPKPVQAPAATDLWSSLRASFAMDDCDADPSIMQWAREYTRNPDRFEQRVNEVLPLVTYAHNAALKHDVAGEFALLPWVESEYRHVPGGKNRPAGMWQIMPETARTLGLKVDKNYDGRMDIAASTDAVMNMMHKYHDDLDDWRLVDIAYNSGEFGLRKTLDAHGMPPADPAIPKIPMKAGTREHLAKLLAIACVVRQPERFNVNLPGETPSAALRVVNVDRPQTLTQAARQSGMSVDSLRQFNPGYMTTRGTIAESFVIPESAAQAYSLASFDATPDPAPTAQERKKESEAQASSQTSGKTSGRGTDSGKTGSYKVGKGDSLSTIAQTHAVTVKQLMSWNGLSSQKLKPGQVLRLSENR